VADKKENNFVINIYPNPASNRITIETDLNLAVEMKQISLYNNIGEKISISNRIISILYNHIEISLTGLPQGNYVIEISSPNGRSRTRVTKM